MVTYKKKPIKKKPVKNDSSKKRVVISETASRIKRKQKFKDMMTEYYKNLAIRTGVSLTVGTGIVALLDYRDAKKIIQDEYDSTVMSVNLGAYKTPADIFFSDSDSYHKQMKEVIRTPENYKKYRMNISDKNPNNPYMYRIYTRPMMIRALDNIKYN